MNNGIKNINYGDVSRRLKELRNREGFSYDDLETQLSNLNFDCKARTLKEHENLIPNSNSIPNNYYKVIVYLSQVYKVSVDYILYGLDYTSTNITIAEICNHLSIDKNTYDQLCRLTKEYKPRTILNLFIQSFLRLIKVIGRKHTRIHLSLSNTDSLPSVKINI